MTVEIQPGLEAEADARLVLAVLENLIGNAWKFTERTADAKIRIGRQAGDAAAPFFIADNGAGNNGNGTATKNTGNNISVRNNFVRGSGDDSFSVNDAALNPAVSDPSFVQMKNPTVINNTAVAPWWANDFGVYGGVNVLVANNIGSGGTAENGIGIGPFAPIGGKFESGKVQGNILFQAGGMGKNEVHGAISVGVGGAWNYDPTQIENLDIRGNTLINPLLPGIQIESLQSTLFSNNTVVNSTSYGAFVNESASGFTAQDNLAVSRHAYAGFRGCDCSHNVAAHAPDWQQTDWTPNDGSPWNPPPAGYYQPGGGSAYGYQGTIGP